jgi:hypothetical protein
MDAWAGAMASYADSSITFNPWELIALQGRLSWAPLLLTALLPSREAVAQTPPS